MGTGSWERKARHGLLDRIAVGSIWVAIPATMIRIARNLRVRPSCKIE